MPVWIRSAWTHHQDGATRLLLQVLGSPCPEATSYPHTPFFHHFPSALLRWWRHLLMLTRPPGTSLNAVNDFTVHWFFPVAMALSAVDCVRLLLAPPLPSKPVCHVWEEYCSPALPPQVAFVSSNLLDVWQYVEASRSENPHRGIVPCCASPRLSPLCPPVTKVTATLTSILSVSRKL